MKLLADATHGEHRVRERARVRRRGARTSLSAGTALGWTEASTAATVRVVAGNYGRKSRDVGGLQTHATAETALQQLSHALRALPARHVPTWVGRALPAALSQQLLGALVDAPVRHVVDACLALRHVSEARSSPW